MEQRLPRDFVSAAPMDLPTPQRPFQRSVFVTVVGWIFVVLTGFAVLIGLLQNVMIWTMTPLRSLHGDWLPLLIFPAFLLLNALGLSCSIGLLLRRNWGRRGLILLLGLGIVWMVVGTVLQWSAFGGASAAGDAGFARMVTMIRVFSLVFSLGIGVTFGLIIRTLCSEPIKAEFIRRRAARG